ncbi:MAG: zinc ribbon domain-containing protein [Acidobacteria bacterium]|nr:zinc ribbon domain-containing protein [Acidobacteriota bacterium]
MPIYEYICADCEKPFEKLIFNAREKVLCPTCGGKHNTQQLSVVASPAKAGGASSYSETGGTSGPTSRPAGPSGGCGSGCGCN